MDDVHSINNPNFSDWVQLKYYPELEINEQQLPLPYC